ncbi:sensor domain-containing diguanylate cyclase [Desulfuromonas versatilis]|nr:sensor domain-containing diguanylate cyclase [Desulfuromonas versatilis]
MKPNRIVLWICLLLVGGFLVTSLASYFVSRASLRREIDQNTLPLTSDNIYSEIQRDLLRPIFISSLMAHDTFLRDWILDGEQEPERISRYLKEIQSKYDTVTSFFVSEKSRIYYHSNGILKKVDPAEERDRWYFRVREMAAEHEINVDPDMANRDAMTIFINHKVYDYAGNYLGATGVGLTVSAVKALIESYRQRFNRDIFFVDPQGKLTLSSTAFAGKGQSLQQIPGLAPLAETILGGDSLALNYQRDGRTVHLNTRYIKEFDWILLVEQDEGRALSKINHALMFNLGICALVTLVVLLITYRALASYQRRLEDWAATDKLTGAYNRKGIDSFFDQTRADCQRSGSAISVILFDLDHFKRVNDHHGHQAGDAVLQEVARRVRAEVRESDLFFRWGGEEFLLLLKGCPLESALELAEKVRAAIGTPPLSYEGQKIPMTASFGVAEFLGGEDLDSLTRRVDQALYQAKAKGRNRVESSPDQPRMPAAAQVGIAAQG